MAKVKKIKISEDERKLLSADHLRVLASASSVENYNALLRLFLRARR